MIEKRLDECRMASVLFTAGLGNAGVPWASVDLEQPKGSGGFDVRVGTLSLKDNGLKEALPKLEWNIPVPAVLPVSDGIAAIVVGDGNRREEAVAALNSVALRLLLTHPAGSIDVSVLDPLGLSLGQYPWLLWPGAVCIDGRAIDDRVASVFSQIERIAASRLQKHPNLLSFNAWATRLSIPALDAASLIIRW